MKEPLVSVIVPVYNTEGYVQACIDSILQQSYTNLEIILVDDGSSDSSGALCDKAKFDDSRVRVIHKGNGGLSDARNAGIRASKGDYLAFVDGDDYVHKEFLKSLLDATLTHNADISACSFYKVYANGRKLRGSKRQRLAILDSTKAIRDILLPSGLCEVMTWNKLYKRNLFFEHDIEFPVGKIHEDVFTTYKLFFFANKIVFIDQPLYFYVQRGSSIKGSGFSRKNLAILEACDDIVKWVDNKDLPLKEEAMYYRISSTLDLLNKISGEAGDTYKQDWKALSQWISSHFNEALFHNKHVSLGQKAMVCSVLLGRRPYNLLRGLSRHIKRQSLDSTLAGGQ